MGLVFVFVCSASSVPWKQQMRLFQTPLNNFSASMSLPHGVKQFSLAQLQDAGLGKGPAYPPQLSPLLSVLKLH